ncbi:MAG: multicopper oxidase domain-containing protein, partial [Quisquiliibacterium sp.]
MPSRESGARMAWTVNGQPVPEHDAKPLVSIAQGRTALIELVNDTMWPHPIHLHGHVFRVVSRNGGPTAHREWRDTVLLEARQ